VSGLIQARHAHTPLTTRDLSEIILKAPVHLSSTKQPIGNIYLEQKFK